MAHNIPQTDSEIWDGVTNNQTPQEFMDISRQQGHATIEEAVDAYVAELPAMVGDDASDDDLARIGAAMARYLTSTRGTEWDIEARDHA